MTLVSLLWRKTPALAGKRLKPLFALEDTSYKRKSLDLSSSLSHCLGAKYRFKVLHGEVRERVRKIIR
jgi:hypothetical protein